MRYQVVAAKSNEGITDRVNEAIRKGWKLQGGITVSTTIYNGQIMFIYCQAMVMES